MKVLSNCINVDIRTNIQKLWFYDGFGFNSVINDPL